MLFRGIHHGHAADLRRLQRLFREGDRIFVVLNDVDLLTAQFADDGLHAHALHAHAGADGIHIFVLRLHRDLGAFAGFAGNGTDLHGAVINLRHFGLEEGLHQFRRGARDSNLWAFGGAIDTHQHHTHTLADGERFKTRLLFLAHAAFSLADVDDHIRAFDAF